MSRSVNVAFFASCHKGILKLCSEQSLDTEKNIFTRQAKFTWIEERFTPTHAVDSS